MKIALINLSKIEDYSKTKYYQDSLSFLKENNIDFVDYFSNRATLPELLDGFHEALKDTSIELIWFIQGGSGLISFLDKINWELVKSSNKEFLGSSDFTHFVYKAVELEKTCYYGSGLKQITDYLPTKEQQQFVIDFLKTKKLVAYDAELLSGSGVDGLEDKKIIGGHSFISAVMFPHTKIDIRDRFFFFEHHYIPGEDLKDIGYFLNAVKLNLSPKPRGIILGHTLLFEKDNVPIDIQVINNYLTKNLEELMVPVYYIDHFKKIIKLS